MDNLEQTIHNDLKIIIELLKTCKDADEYDDLSAIYDVLNKIAVVNNIDPIEYDNIDELYKKLDLDSYVQEINRRIINNYSNNYRLNKKIANVVKDLKEPYNTNQYKPSFTKTISNNKTISYMLDFFKNYDDQIYLFIKDYLNYNRLFFINNLYETSGGCILDCDKYLKSYTFIENNNKIIDFVTIVHELIHIYIKDLEFNFTKEQKTKLLLNNFDEVYSNFIELIAIDYLKENTYDKDEVYSLKVDYDNDMIENLALYNKLLFKKKRYLRNLEMFIHAEMYSYGKVLAYHFYEQYKNDPSNAKINIKNFSLDSSIYNKRHLLNNYGLDKSDVFSSKVLKKNLY